MYIVGPIRLWPSQQHCHRTGEPLPSSHRSTSVLAKVEGVKWPAQGHTARSQQWRGSRLLCPPPPAGLCPLRQVLPNLSFIILISAHTCAPNWFHRRTTKGRVWREHRPTVAEIKQVGKIKALPWCPHQTLVSPPPPGHRCSQSDDNVSPGH